jgi:hypothetical protein
MFVQVYQGPVSDPSLLESQWLRWDVELRPGATGFLGATAGIAPDGYFYALARFESAASAQTNSERPEQGAWWSKTQQAFADEVQFTGSEDVTTFLAGGSDEAGFVQILQSPSTDRQRLEAMDELFEKHAAGWRPEVIGGIRAWTPDGAYTEAVYFTSQEAARAGESSEPPAEVAAHMDEFQALVGQARFADLAKPWLA